MAMKISFSLKIKGQKISEPEPFEVPYLYEGNICSVIVYGSLSKPQILVESLEEKKQLPLTSKYWFFIRISWSRVGGFKFCQYSDPETTTSLSSTTGSLRGGDKIELGNNLATIIFKAEVNQEDLNTIDQTIFLEKCSEFGIRVVDTKFSNLDVVSDFSCPNSQLVNVEFVDAQLERADFSNSYLSQVKFFNSNLNHSNFVNTIFSQVEFNHVQLESSSFDNCTVRYSKSRREKDEVLLFKNGCDLTNSSFTRAKLCSKLEKVDLSSANFSDAKLVACKFDDCKLISTIFSRTEFKSLGTQNNQNQRQDPQNQNDSDLINCCIINTTEFENCDFNHASMTLIDFSDNTITNTNFEAANLYKAKLYNCKFIESYFQGKTYKPAFIRETYIYKSHFQECHLSEVNFFKAKMINVEFNNCELIRANFYLANLRSSKFIDSNLTGIDFRYADLTLLEIKGHQLNGANFFKTRRGGMKVSIENEGSESKNKDFYDSFKWIDWSPELDGQIQINKDSFISIIEGQKSPVDVLSELSQKSPQLIQNIYAQANATSDANAKSAGGDLNDASVNIEGDANDSSINGGSIETNPNKEFEEDENNQLDTNQSESHELLDAYDEQV